MPDTAWNQFVRQQGGYSRLGGAIVQSHTTNPGVCLSTTVFTLVITSVLCVLCGVVGVGVLFVLQRRRSGERRKAAKTTESTSSGPRLFSVDRPPSRSQSHASTWMDSQAHLATH